MAITTKALAKTFPLYRAEVEVRAPIRVSDADAEKLATELDELTDLLDETARTFLTVRRTRWRRFGLKLTVR